MATTNFVRVWRNADRLFVYVNGATIEARSFRVDEQVVILEFYGVLAPIHSDWSKAANLAVRRTAARCCVPGLHDDPLLDECLW